MNKDDRAFTKSLDLLELSIEYFIYYTQLRDIPREEALEDLKRLILSTVNECEQIYYYDEDDDLICPDHIDQLRDFMLSCSKTAM